MRTPEDRVNAVPGAVPGFRYLHDFERCATLASLREVMETINSCQYQLISVTQDSSDIFTVFFRRCILG